MEADKFLRGMGYAQAVKKWENGADLIYSLRIAGRISEDVYRKALPGLIELARANSVEHAIKKLEDHMGARVSYNTAIQLCRYLIEALTGKGANRAVATYTITDVFKKHVTKDQVETLLASLLHPAT